LFLEEFMETLEFATPAISVCTRDRARSTAFYRDSLGLVLERDDALAAVFRLGGVTLRIATVADFTPHGHTMLGFCVPDVAETVKSLRARGVAFERFSHLPQDEAGIFTLAGGKIHVAWFKDPDGNILSVTDV
jgi:catechol 2,3-dioxygenase-like lactoylglutathione lyase family enzyme